MIDGREIYKNFLKAIWSAAEHIFKLAAWGSFTIGFSIIISKNSPQHMWIAKFLGLVWFFALMSALPRAMDALNLIPLNFRHNYKFLLLNIILYIAAPFFVFSKLYPILYDIFLVTFSAGLLK